MADYPPTLQEGQNEAETPTLSGAAGPTGDLLVNCGGGAAAGRVVCQLAYGITSAHRL